MIMDILNFKKKNKNSTFGVFKGSSNGVFKGSSSYYHNISPSDLSGDYSPPDLSDDDLSLELSEDNEDYIEPPYPSSPIIQKVKPPVIQKTNQNNSSTYEIFPLKGKFGISSSSNIQKTKSDNKNKMEEVD